MLTVKLFCTLTPDKFGLLRNVYVSFSNFKNNVASLFQ